MEKKVMKWKTKDGRILLLRDMSVDHLKNVAALLRKNGYCSMVEFDLTWASISSCRGDMATYYAEQTLANMRPTRALDLIDAEIERRRS